MSMLVDSPGTLRPMLRLTMPVVGEQLLHLLVGFSDMWLAGNLLGNEAYVAAMALVIYSVWLVANVFSFVALGATAMTARFVGAGDMPLANRAMNQSLTAGFVWAGLLMLLAIPQIDWFVALMGLEGTAAAAAERFLYIELAVLPAIMIERVGIACLRGAGDTTSGLATMGTVNVINIVASYSLATGVGPLPELGWTGIAAGTAIGHGCGAVIVLALLIGGRAGYRLRLAAMRPDADIIRRLLRIGIPGGTDMMIVNVCQLAFLRIILELGDVPAAAHGVAIQVEALAFMPGIAFQIAASTMTGQYLGAQDYHRAHRGVLLAAAITAGLMTTIGAVFYLAATPLVSFFLGGHDSIAVPVAAELVRVVAVMMFPLAVTLVVTGALRGAGDTRWPLLVTILGFVVIRIPLAIYLVNDEFTLPVARLTISGWGLGVVGAWYAMVTDVTIRSLLLSWRFFHGGWKRIEV